MNLGSHIRWDIAMSGGEALPDDLIATPKHIRGIK
jgi:hypothetical protein